MWVLLCRVVLLPETVLAKLYCSSTETGMQAVVAEVPVK